MLASNRRAGRPAKYINITEKKHGLPYSKGLMASSIMATGLAPSRAFKVAKMIEDALLQRKKYDVTITQLRDLTQEILLREVGEEYALKHRQWQELSRLEKPIIILVGGTTGVGKSTIATEVAHRLGITRIISTDSIREVMRTIFSEELMPALYNSSFDAWLRLRMPLPESTDPVIVGFREQTAAVATGVKALIQRSITEGTNQVIEGVHIVPGFIDFSVYENDALVIPLLITVDEVDLHRSHFYIRELESEGFRPFERYRANFDNIRKIGDFIKRLAMEKNIPVISSLNLDNTISDVLDKILEQAMVYKKKFAAKRKMAKITMSTDV